MKRIRLAGLIVAAGAFLLTPVFGQQLSIPGPESALIVTVTGSAEAPADWVEVNLAAEGKGVNAQEGLVTCQEVCDAAAGELVGLGIPEGDIRFGPPEISTDEMAQMMRGMPDDGAQPQYTVSRSLVVRLTEVSPETLYEDVCRIIDVAAEGGAGPKSSEPLSSMMNTGGLVTFGVNDPKPLRAKALANGFEQAREVADMAAAASGRTVQAVGSVTVQESANEGLMAMVNIVAFADAPSQAAHRVLLTVTYAVE